MFVNVYRQILSLQSWRVVYYVCLFVSVLNITQTSLWNLVLNTVNYNGISCHGIKLQKVLVIIFISPVSLTIVNINCWLRAAESQTASRQSKDQVVSDFTFFSYSDDGQRGYGL